ncbi:hypothetical protein D3C87_1472710 [compost metagenome]
MSTSNTNGLFPSFKFESHGSIFADRLIILRNLITLWEVGIKVILTRKNRSTANITSESKSRLNGILHSFLVENRQRPRHPYADRRCVFIITSIKGCGIAGKNFTFCAELHVDLNTNDGFVSSRRHGDVFLSQEKRFQEQRRHSTFFALQNAKP